MLLYKIISSDPVCCHHKYFFAKELFLNWELTFQCFRSIARRCSIKKLFWEILQNSQENACAMFYLFYLFVGYSWKAASNVFNVKKLKVPRLTFYLQSLFNVKSGFVEHTEYERRKIKESLFLFYQISNKINFKKNICKSLLFAIILLCFNILVVIILIKCSNKFLLYTCVFGDTDCEELSLHFY